MPAAFHIAMYFPGFPAPVVTIFTPSSTTILANSSACGCISMMLTPKGWSVSARQWRMFSLRASASIPPEPIRPSAPALEQAAANSPVAILAIPPWIMGYFVPKISLSSFIFYPHTSAAFRPRSARRQNRCRPGSGRGAVNHFPPFHAGQWECWQHWYFHGGPYFYKILTVLRASV